MNIRNDMGRFFCIASLMCLVGFIGGEGFCGETVATSKRELLLYRVDDDYERHPDGRVPVDESLPIQQKMRLLLDEISRRHYPDLPPIEILETLKTKDGLVAVLNLTEQEQEFFKSRWYQKFGGSLGWKQTYCQLIETPLQPDYPGFWFSGVKLYWNGKPLDEDIEISGVIFRVKSKGNSLEQ
ncbi:MAG TPA: hypothetical protein PK590_03620 [Candidatus Omnitrophota bacterium]|nr:hypothetical protein [Candidatus Omnitrophota bacterium]